MISVKKYIESNKDRFIEELFSLIRIPSISAKHEHKPDMEACAKRWTELLLAAGADKAVVMQTEGNPVVYGEKMVSPEAQTVLVYSHYDVMTCGRVARSNPKSGMAVSGRVVRMMIKGRP